ncbi:hypothetical protein D9M68_759550 [compost metagenome]
MVDVGRDDGAAAGHFLTHELRGDFLRNGSAEAVAGVLLLEQAGFARLGQLHVFTDGDEFHLGRDDALLRVVHLGDVLAGLGAARVAHVGKAHGGQLGIGQAALAELGGQARQALGVVAVVDPGRAYIGQALAHVDADVRVGVGAGGVIDGDRGIDLAAEGGGGHIQADFTHGHADVRAGALNIDFLRAGERLDGLLIYLGAFTQVSLLFCSHRLAPGNDVGANLKAECTGTGAERSLPECGMGRHILFPTQALT